jgi:hypothetical protein
MMVTETNRSEWSSPVVALLVVLWAAVFLALNRIMQGEPVVPQGIFQFAMDAFSPLLGIGIIGVAIELVSRLFSRTRNPIGAIFVFSGAFLLSILSVLLMIVFVLKIT